MEQVKDFQELLRLKTKTKRDIMKKVEKYSKQENIIIKVLDIINKAENKTLFEEKDADLDKKYEDIEKRWKAKRSDFEKYRRVKENQEDIDYFIDNALY